MRNLLFIHSTQFGYHNNAYMYCKYLKDLYNISFICYDQGRKRVNMDGVTIYYVSRRNKYLSLLIYFPYVLYRILRSTGTVFVFYFRGCHILKRFFPKRHMILDVRTLSVSDDRDYNEKWNADVKKSVMIFDYVTFISSGIRKKLGCDNLPSTILPLGSEVISLKKKDYSRMNLLYVGTLNNRKIEKTIWGLSMFLEQNPKVSLSYDIIGDGYGNEVEELQSLVNELQLVDIVRVHGRIPHTEIGIFFDNCNIGVSFIPITDYYDYQPPTKTFEYALSGLFTIATSTFANKEVISPNNGLLINDSAEGFSQALSLFLKINNTIDENAIRSSLVNYRWDTIVYNVLMPVLEK